MPRAPRVIVVGGGAAGIAAGIWAVRLGLRVVVLEATKHLGGQLRAVLSPITDYPGLPDVDGPGLAARMVDHLRSMRVPVRLGCRVDALEPRSGRVITSSAQRLQGDGIIVATGARRRRLGLAEEQRWVGRGLSYSVSRDAGRLAGQVSVIVGGGDNAMEAAAWLGALCPEVHLVHRSALAARPDFIRAAQAEPNVRWHPGRRVVGLRGADRLEAVLLDDGTRIDCAGLFVCIGVQPSGALSGASLPCDERGFVVVDPNQRATGRVYAVGDVCAPRAMAVSVSAGQAMIACKDIQSRWR